MNNLFSQKGAVSSLTSLVKAALAICVAGAIAEQIAKRPDNEAKLLRIRIASDALDKTMPTNTVMNRYESKPAGQTDAQFLLANLEFVHMLEPDCWPERKVQPREWGEYTRVMRGMEAFLRKAFTDENLTKEDATDIGITLKFIEGHLPYIPFPEVRALLKLV